MTTLSHAQDAGTRAKRFTIGSDVRATAHVMAIIGAAAIASFALLSRAHFAPSAIMNQVESKPPAGVSDNGYRFGDNAADAQAAREAAAKVLCAKFCKTEKLKRSWLVRWLSKSPLE